MISANSNILKFFRSTSGHSNTPKQYAKAINGRSVTPAFNETMNKKIRLISFPAFLAVFLVGCSKEPPKCSDNETLTLVRQIIVDQLGGREGVSDKELHENMKFEFPRANAFDESIKKYSCEAKLVAGNSVEMPVVFESQLDDNNRHIVFVDGILRRDLLALKIAIAEGVKTSREENGGAALVSPESYYKGQATVPDNLPLIALGTPYSEAREIMINEGWEPIKMPEADVCSEFDDRCKGRPEMEACAGSGMANCKFSWKKKEALMRICTVGEEPTFASFCN